MCPPQTSSGSDATIISFASPGVTRSSSSSSSSRTMKYKTILTESNDRGGREKKAAGVSFGPVHVREHERVLLEDAVLAMSWVYLPCHVFSSVDEYHAERTKTSSSSLAVLSKRLCSVEERTKLLCDYGFTEPEIHRANQDERNRRLRMEYLKYKQRGERSSVVDLVESIKSFGLKLTADKKKRRRRRKRLK
jgi:hypothetical protein